MAVALGPRSPSWNLGYIVLHGTYISAMHFSETHLLKHVRIFRTTVVFQKKHVVTKVCFVDNALSSTLCTPDSL